MSHLNFVWKGSAWEPESDVELQSVTEFEPSSHLIWADNGEPRILALEDGVRLGRPRQKKGSFTLNDQDVGFKLQPCNLPQPITVVVTFPSAGEVRLTSEALGAVAGEVDADTIVVTAEGETKVSVPLSRSAAWSAIVERDHLPQLLQGLTVASLDKPVRLHVRWVWRGSASSYFVRDGGGVPTVFPEGFVPSNRLRDAGVVMADAVPTGAYLEAHGARWLLESALERGMPELPTGKAYAFADADRRPVPLSAAVARLDEPVRFGAPGFDEAEVAAPPVLKTARLQLVPTRQRQVVASVEGAEPPVWDYGPLTMLFPQPGEVLEARVFDMESGPNPGREREDVKWLAAGKLRTAYDKSPTYVFCDKRASDRYGVYHQVSPIPPGRWVSIGGLGPGAAEVVLSWRGFVDRAAVRTVDLDGQARSVLQFRTGVRLMDKLWFVAPFVGVAMPKDASWWGSLKDPSISISRTADAGWRVTGEWIAIADGRAVALAGCVIPPSSAPRLVALTGSNYGDAAPILELGGVNPPAFVGWLADAQGAIPTGGAAFRIGPAWNDAIELPENAAADGLPDDLQEAFAAARSQRGLEEGTTKRSRWRRELRPDLTQVIRLWIDASASGVCRLDPAGSGS
jgi:hypothetical protein